MKTWIYMQANILHDILQRWTWYFKPTVVRRNTNMFNCFYTIPKRGGGGGLLELFSEGGEPLETKNLHHFQNSDGQTHVYLEKGVFDPTSKTKTSLHFQKGNPCIQGFFSKYKTHYVRIFKWKTVLCPRIFFEKVTNLWCRSRILHVSPPPPPPPSNDTL